MKNMCRSTHKMCEFANANGYCMITACSKYMKLVQVIYPKSNNIITFPQAIGNITFYTNKELIKWVEDQQQINEDTDYGIGNWS